MKNYLNITYYIKTLYDEGTLWEFKRILGAGQRTSNPNLTNQKRLKRLLISIPSIVLCYLLKTGISTDFITDIMAALSIFIGLFTNVIFVIYNRFSIIPIDTPTTNNNVKIENLKLKNFLRQFTFVTGKNLLVATVIIALLTIIILFESFFNVNIRNFELVEFPQWNCKNILTFLQLLIVVFVRFQILYLIINFFLLLLYSLGALFTFLKREMK